MNALSDLERALFLSKVGLSGVADCIQWAVDRLVAGEEGDDLDIVLLAGAKGEEEARPLAEKIVERYADADPLREQRVCGKYVCEMHRRYRAGGIAISELEPIFYRLFVKLGYPSWLVMLTRNCEYASDTDGFVRHFEDEFDYVARLWQDASSTREFLERYSRDISNSHDIQRADR